MILRRLSRVFPVKAALAVVLIALAGCGNTASGDPSAGGEGRFEYVEGMVGAADEATEPQAGGTLTYGAYNEPPSLDPASTIVAGSTGGNEMTAIYDTLMRYDTEAQEFIPRLAKSLEHDADGAVWSLRLREGVEFSDGTVLDAAAVKASQQRYANYTSPEAGTWNANVASIKVVDELTLEYRMKAPFAWFGSLLSTGPGMVVPPSSAPPGAQDFEPIGAGPFTYAGRKPGEEITLAANPSYWNGRPRLDGLRFVFLGDQTTTQDALTNGDIDAGHFRFPDLVDGLLADGVAGYMNLLGVGSTVLVNGMEGRPGADPRVRLAMQLAIDPETIRQRAYKGHGLASSRVFPEYSRWYVPEVDALKHDPARAKELLEEAMADGYDGHITFLGYNAPQIRDVGQVFKASLEAIGFSVKLEMLPNSTAVAPRVVAQQDYDVAAWGLNFREGDPYAKLFSSLHSKATQTYGMPTSPDMDAALEELQGALEPDAAHEALADVQRAYNETVPFLSWMPFADMTAWSKDVHGITGAANSVVEFDQAWKS